MARGWILQASPKRYDIDRALASLQHIWWRVPQYTSEIGIGDEVAIWRSGKNPGVVGVGRVETLPQQHSADPSEQAFFLGDEQDAADSTRVLVRVVDAPLLTKHQFEMLPGLSDHQIVTAPMGTVFPMTSDQWEVLRELLPPTPSLDAQPEVFDLPAVFAWAQRAKGVMPMPGGYDGYLDTLRTLTDRVEEDRPLRADLPALVERTLDVRSSAARLRAGFLRKAGIISEEDGVCCAGPWTLKWMETGDPRLIVSLIHSRCQLIGELLEMAAEPVTTSELLQFANKHFGMGWDTQTQIDNRRGWLQSAGMLEVVTDGKLQTTSAGRALVSELSLQSLIAEDEVPDLEREPVEPNSSAETQAPPTTVVTLLTQRLGEASVDSKNPDNFEQAVCQAFSFLGFSAQWLGGSGKTDVLLDAPLGRDDAYRVIVDCKTSGSGSVSDQQIDWVTLGEHKLKHAADYVAVVAPNPSGSRLYERAEQQGVTIISNDQLSGLCRQHAKTPVALTDYRTMFEVGGTVDTQLTDERASEVGRLVALASACCEAIRSRSVVFGRITARDLFLILADEAVAEGTSELELEVVLGTLASPLLGILDGNSSKGYRETSSSGTARLRLDLLSRALN